MVVTRVTVLNDPQGSRYLQVWNMYICFGLTLWLCSGQIDPKKIFFLRKILVNVIALDSNLLTLFTLGISTSH